LRGGTKVGGASFGGSVGGGGAAEEDDGRKTFLLLLNQSRTVLCVQCLFIGDKMVTTFCTTWNRWIDRSGCEKYNRRFSTRIELSASVGKCRPSFK
jgi:hypothetical protein